MANVDWSIKGVEYGGCNCAFGCPCQFEALPTEGHCRGFEAVRIEQGHFGDVRLDGLSTALFYAWPGPIFEGNGMMQAVIDERADEAQRDALTRILHGEETEEFATHWYVYRSTMSTVHEPLFKPIELEIEVAERTARLAIPGLIESTGSPIRSPATGELHRALIKLPDGMEFTEAEIGTTTTRAGGTIELDLDNQYGQFNYLHHTAKGPVR